MANFLVTGGAGFIGSHLARFLLERGHAVRVLDNFSTGSRENLAEVAGRVELIEGDARDGAAAAAAVADMDYVLHQAAIPSVVRSLEAPVETTDCNVVGTVALLEAARRAGARRFVYAASSSAYGDRPEAVKDESLAPQPLSPYAAAKLAGEQFCQAFHHCHGLQTVCLRYFNVFGPRQDPDSPYSAAIPRFIRAALAGERPEIYGDGLQSRDFCYVDNVTRANLLAAESSRGAGGVFNIACGRAFSMLDLLAKIGAILGVRLEPRFLAPRPGDVRHSLASIEKARRTFGYEPAVDLDEGLRRTADSMRRPQAG